MRKYIGEVGLIITAIIWGSGFVASAISLDYFTPSQILLVRFLIGGVILGAVFYKKIFHIKKRTLIRGAIIGTFLYLAFALQTVGLQYTTPSKNAFITAVNVVIVPFIAFFIYKKKIDSYELFGAITALVGVGIISLKLSSEINIGDLLTLACAFAFAFHIFYISKFVKEEDPAHLAFLQLMTAAIIGAIVVLLKGDTQIVYQMESAGVLSLLYLGVFSTTVAYLLQTFAQKSVTETTTAIILSMESVWGMVFSALILKEVITLKMLIGATLIIAAIIVSDTKLSFLKKKKFNVDYKL